MTLQEKREILKNIFSMTDALDQRVKDKIEGIVIGASLREHAEDLIDKDMVS